MAKKNKKADQVEEELEQQNTGDEETPEEYTEEPAEEQVTEEAPAEEYAAPESETAGETAEEPAPEQPSAPAASAPEGSVGTVTRQVNFRTGASFRNAVIMELKPGAKVVLNGTVEGDKGTWYKCVFDGREGYVKASGISV